MTALFRARGVTQRFGPTVALDGVSLDLERGQVRVLLGANGAGKSTLLGVIGGVMRVEDGVLELAGARFGPRSPAAARHAGVVSVAQEPAIVPELSVEANVMLGAEQTLFGCVRRSRHAAVASAALARLGHGSLALDRRAGDLSLALRHVIAIARALVLEARVVVLDEPTSTLSADDAAHVIAAVRELATQGVAVLYVTHFLDEVARVGDTFSVLRDGRLVAEGDARRTTVRELVGHVSGRELTAPAVTSGRERGDVVLSVNGLSGRESPLDIDLFVCRGEVLGLFGLGGSGRAALLRTILGADERVRGSVRVDGRVLAPGPRAGVRAGIGMLAQDRSQSLFPGLCVADQVTIARLEPLSSGGFLGAQRVSGAARAALQAVSASHVDPQRPIGELSGGTQQRVALARLVHQSPAVLLLDEPTRGVDVDAKLDIRRWIDETAQSGRAIVISSSMEDELLAVCDTIAVMRSGRIVESRSASNWTRADLVSSATGGAAA